MKNHARLSAAAAWALVLLGSTGAAGFEPISFTELESLYGKTVYPSRASRLFGSDDAWVYAGEPLTLLSCEPREKSYTTLEGKKIRGWYHETCQVRSGEGATGKIDLAFLSKTRLGYNLRAPGSATELPAKLLAEAYPLARRIHAMSHKIHYIFKEYSTVERHQGKTLVGNTYHQVYAMAVALGEAHDLMRWLMRGARNCRDAATCKGHYRWVVYAKDKRFLTWMSKGMQDERLQIRYAHVYNCLDALREIAKFRFKFRNVEEKRARKRWRRDARGVPEQELAAMDAAHLAELDARRKELTEELARMFEEMEDLKIRADWSRRK
jgi:hypothetical protein